MFLVAFHVQGLFRTPEPRPPNLGAEESPRTLDITNFFRSEKFDSYHGILALSLRKFPAMGINRNSILPWMDKERKQVSTKILRITVFSKDDCSVAQSCKPYSHATETKVEPC